MRCLSPLGLNSIDEFLLFLLSLLTFQVIKWIEEHGETFLVKHTGVGKSLVKAEALLKRHEEFESIAQVSDIAISQIDNLLL